MNDPDEDGRCSFYRLKFSGDSLGNLYELTGVLPISRRFETDGRLVAKSTLKPFGSLIIAGFNGRIGDSDIHGSLVYTTGKPRPKTGR
ncbi:hypothetical protein ACLK1T_13855 [Escherichia coli]